MNLAAEMSKLPEPPNDSHPPEWDHWRFDLWQRAQEDDPHNFTKWPAIYHTMLVSHWKSIIESIEIQYVDNNAPKFRQIIQPFNTSDFLNYIHQAYHILRWQEMTGLNISDMGSIYEFGGGYGAMALVCNRLGFKGKYYIYDLPEFSLLQQWYLEECGIDNVEWIDNRQHPLGDVSMDVDLMIACYSLSETGFEQRSFVLTEVLAGSYLFLYSNRFEQFDNATYFQHPGKGEGFEFNPLRYETMNWRHERIEHLPPESWYSWGW